MTIRTCEQITTVASKYLFIYFLLEDTPYKNTKKPKKKRKKETNKHWLPYEKALWQQWKGKLPFKRETSSRGWVGVREETRDKDMQWKRARD